jgi:hypothetical protein
VFNHVFSSEEKVLTYFPIRSFDKNLKLVTQPMLLIYWVNDARMNLYQIYVFGADPKSKASAMAGQHFSNGHYHHQYGRYCSEKLLYEVCLIQIKEQSFMHFLGSGNVVTSETRIAHHLHIN